MASGLVDVMKRASMDAIETSQPCDLRFGTVARTSPLNVRVSAQMVLPESLLIVPEHLTDHTVNVEVEWDTEDGGGGAGAQSHAHAIVGIKKMKIKNALKEGDKVALLRKQGGQSYYILDRI